MKARPVAPPAPTSSGRGESARRMMTDRERDIVDLLATGASRKDIARQLHLSPKTVRNRLSDLYQQFGASNAVEFLVMTEVLVRTEPWE